jgi:hypothetical protein
MSWAGTPADKYEMISDSAKIVHTLLRKMGFSEVRASGPS